MAQQGYGPPSLPVGTEVSAKYRGAFCEAKVKNVVKVVKCKVQVKDSQTSVFMTDDEIKGPLKLGAIVEVKHPTTGQPVEATVHKLIDHSLYTVVFDDGDERTLRRTQLCLKGDKHFIESETLDNLPLSHPEHFGTPVLQNKKGKRKNDDEEEEEDSEDESPRRAMYRGRHQELVGRLFLVDLPQRKGSAIPALVVLPDSNSIGEVKRSDQILVRSFKDSKYLTVTRKNLKDFSRTVAIKNEDKTMRTAFEKALLYFDTKELPVGWKKDDMLGSDIEDEEVVEDNEYASEDEPYEEKDRFVAQLYKFMDDRGTPINKGPCIGNKDLNLYKLFKIVQNYGGYNKVTKEMKWHVVYSKMGLPSIHQNPAHQVKSAYKKYLDAYETFYRKLGSTMGTLSRPGRVRQNSGRSILSFRSREKSPRMPKPPVEKKEEQEAPKSKAEVTEKCEDSQDSGSTASVEETDLVTRRTTQRRDRVQLAKEREESKEREKKEEAAKVKEKKDDAAKAKKEEVAATTVKTKKEEVATPLNKGKKEEVATPLNKGKKEEVASPLNKGKKEEVASPLNKGKKEEVASPLNKGKKEEVASPLNKGKKEEVASPLNKGKKEEVASPLNKGKKEEVASQLNKGKKEEVTSKVKKEEASAKKEERKSVRKLVKTEEEKDEKDEKKPARAIRKEKEEIAAAPAPVSPKKRLTRRKLLQSDPLKKEVEPKEESEEKIEPMKKGIPKELRASVGEKKEKEIPRTLERRDSKTLERKGVVVKTVDIKAPVEKKVFGKTGEEKKPVKRDKKGKETEKEENMSESEDDEELDEGQNQKQERPSSPKIDYPIGSKLRVKYGKGKNQKMYIAKVVDYGKDGPHRTYLVHYAGWNMRYDEWIRGDRVASILDKPGLDKPVTPKTTDVAKPALKVHVKPLTNSLKRLTTHRTPILTKKTGQIFRTPKLVTAKTRATRSSSSETSASSPTTSSDKRTTRRRSVVSDTGGEDKTEENQTEDKEEKLKSEDKQPVLTKEGEEESQLIDIEDEDQEDASVEKNDLDTSIEDDGEEVEEASEEKEDDGKMEQLEATKDQVDDEQVDNHEVKEEESEPEVNDTKAENEGENIEESVDQDADDDDDDDKELGESLPIQVKVEKPGVMVAEMVTADDEITSALIDDVKEEEDEVKTEIITDPSCSQESEKEDKEVHESTKEPQYPGDVIHSLEEDIKKVDEAHETEKKPDLLTSVDEEEEIIRDQSIPLLKKMDMDVDKKEVDKTKVGKGRKKEGGKDAKKSGRSTLDASLISAEIPTLEPIIMSSEPLADKSSPSPYDFDDTEHESQWQPEISKKWDPVITEQTPGSKESTPVPGDVMDKEKKKVKKKTKKKIISPQFVSESKSEDSSASSQPVESVSNPAETSVNEEDKSGEKQSQKKKGRKRKEAEARPEVIEQYESAVNNVVEAVKHSLREESPERDNKPAPKKRRLKRASESDKKDVGRAFKAERRRGLRDSQDTVEALNVEGSKGKSAVREQSLVENVAMLKASQSKDSLQAVNSTAADKSDSKVSIDGADNDDCVISETQPFVPTVSEERDSSAAHYENTPPTTPEHEEGDGSAIASQPPPCTSPCSDDLALKADLLKDGSSSSSSSMSLPGSSSNMAPVKSASDSPSDNDIGSTTSNDNLDTALIINQSSESSGTEEVSQSRKRKPVEEPPATSAAKKKKRVHGTRSRTAKKSPKYINTDSVSYQSRASDSHFSTSATPNHYPESPLSRLADLTKSPRPSKYNFNADLGEYLEGEERCNFLITKMKEIKAIYMNLKSEVASIDRRRKRIRRKERESSQASPNERDSVR